MQFLRCAHMEDTMLDKKDTQKLYDLFANLVSKKSYLLIDSLFRSAICEDLSQKEMLNILYITHSDRDNMKMRCNYIENCVRILEQRKEKISPNFKAFS